jgi:RNA polymerase sigma factor (sigma-70 family)
VHVIASLKDRMATIRAFVRGRGGPIDDVEDIVQEAFLRLHVHALNQFVMHEDAFLKRTVRNLVVDRHRRRHEALYVRERPEELGLRDLRPTPDEHWSMCQDLDQLGATLEALPLRTREIFLMRRLDGYSSTEISKRFAISVSAVEKHLSRAASAIRAVSVKAHSSAC